MLISCKVSNALITFLERRGSDLEALFESFDLPAELLRDSSAWCDAQAMEGFLQALDVQFNDVVEGSLLTEAGHQSRELFAWGVLDSVLRMVQSPKDIFTQPDRFLAYFISPPPPVAALKRFDEGVQFDVPLSRGEYPFFTEYLCAAMESLPTYVHQPHFKVSWEGHTLRAQWSLSQPTMLDEGDSLNRQLEPEMVRRMLSDLEEQQRKLEKAQKELVEKELEIEKLRGSFSEHAPEVPQDALAASLQDLYTLRDYWLRASQLITLLVKQGRMDGQVREAMRRVDWEKVVMDSPHLIHKASGFLQSLHARSTEPAPSPKPKGASSKNRDSAGPNLTLPLNS